MNGLGGNVDWDLLADHLGGALAGTAEGTRVAQLVATDPDWSAAATELSGALASVATDLAALPAPAMPDGVTQRLAAALSGAAGTRSASVPTPRHRELSAPDRPPRGARRPPTRPGSRPRRRRVAQWGAGLAVAAGLVAFAAIGYSAWDLSPSIIAGEGDDSAGGQAADEPQEVAPETTGGRLSPLATGTDYQPSTLARREPAAFTPDRAGGDGESGPAVQGEPDAPLGTNQLPAAVPPSLSRLWSDPAALDRCLELVRAELAPAPVTIDTVDFARFRGGDAIVIWLTTADGTRYGWVSGPTCGIAGPDERFRTELT